MLRPHGFSEPVRSFYLGGGIKRLIDATKTLRHEDQIANTL